MSWSAVLFGAWGWEVGQIFGFVVPSPLTCNVSLINAFHISPSISLMVRIEKWIINDTTNEKKAHSMVCITAISYQS